eukprot:jgi/Undpi1/12831/HiC_scaffold_7.g02498.m1
MTEPKTDKNTAEADVSLAKLKSEFNAESTSKDAESSLYAKLAAGNTAFGDDTQDKELNAGIYADSGDEDDAFGVGGDGDGAGEGGQGGGNGAGERRGKRRVFPTAYSEDEEEWLGDEDEDEHDEQHNNPRGSRRRRKRPRNRRAPYWRLLPGDDGVFAVDWGGRSNLPALGGGEVLEADEVEEEQLLEGGPEEEQLLEGGPEEGEGNKRGVEIKQEEVGVEEKEERGGGKDGKAGKGEMEELKVDMNEVKVEMNKMKVELNEVKTEIKEETLNILGNVGVKQGLVEEEDDGEANKRKGDGMECDRTISSQPSLVEPKNGASSSTNNASSGGVLHSEGGDVERDDTIGFGEVLGGGERDPYGRRLGGAGAGGGENCLGRQMDGVGSGEGVGEGGAEGTPFAGGGSRAWGLEGMDVEERGEEEEDGDAFSDDELL